MTDIPTHDRLDIAVIGGGAAGFFGAITRAESAAPPVSIRIFESGSACLRKVEAAGGGRCNLTHACQSVKDFCQHYPRGARELLGPMHTFGPAETRAWFEAHGVVLKTEPDGRVFPASDTSRAVVNCLLSAARRSKIQIDTNTPVTRLVPLTDGRFELHTAAGETQICGTVMLAMGGGSRKAYELVRKLNHTISTPVPALFGIKTGDTAFNHLAGLAVHDCELTLPDLHISSRGAALFTHWGITGPAALKLSSLGAKSLHEHTYKTPLYLNFCPALKPVELVQAFRETARHKGAARLCGSPLFNLPSRLWKTLVAQAGIPADLSWSRLSGRHRQALITTVTRFPSSSAGQTPSRDEMVTAGGVKLSEISFKTMASNIHPGLHIAGELLDIDGLTGGFNLQAAWTTGYLAGKAMGEGCSDIRGRALGEPGAPDNGGL